VEFITQSLLSLLANSNSHLCSYIYPLCLLSSLDEFFLILDIILNVSECLWPSNIILVLYQLCSTWLLWTSRILKIAIVSKESHSVLLNFPRGELCIRYYSSMNLDFPRVVISTKLPWFSPSCSDTSFGLYFIFWSCNYMADRWYNI